MKIKDIAKELHLSVSTVSKALNGAFDVSKETKELERQKELLERQIALKEVEAKNNEKDVENQAREVLRTTTESKIKKDKYYEDEGELRGFFDDTFLLNYLALCTLNKDEYSTKNAKEKVIKQVIQKIIDLNSIIFL